MKRLNLTKGEKIIISDFLVVVISTFIVTYLSWKIECSFRMCAGFSLYVGLVYLLCIWFYTSRRKIIPFLSICALSLGVILIGVSAEMIGYMIVFLIVLLWLSKTDAKKLSEEPIAIILELGIPHEETQEEKK